MYILTIAPRTTNLQLIACQVSLKCILTNMVQQYDELLNQLVSRLVLSYMSVCIHGVYLVGGTQANTLLKSDKHISKHSQTVNEPVNVYSNHSSGHN